jgi:hypothetical protein
MVASPSELATVPSIPATSPGRLLLEKIPFLLMAALSSIVTLYAQQQGGATSSIEALPVLNRVANAFVAYLTYIVKTFWPRNLAVMYPLPDALDIWPVMVSGVILAGISIVVIKGARKHPEMVVGWLWFLGTLVPVIGLVQVGRQAMADRYTYIPLIGLFIMVTWGVAEFAANSPFRRTILGIAAGLCLAACSVITWGQLSYWQNSIKLFEHACQVVPNNYVAHFALGNVLAEEGRYPDAAAHLQEALRIAPYFRDAHYSIGKIYLRTGNPDQARYHFTEVLRFDPSHGKARRALESISSPVPENVSGMK